MNTTTEISENVKRLLLDENFLISVFGFPFDRQGGHQEADMKFVSLYTAAEINKARDILLHLDKMTSLTSSADMMQIREYIASFLKRRHKTVFTTK